MINKKFNSVKEKMSGFCLFATDVILYISWSRMSKNT